MKGSLWTSWEKAGNDYDQAALLSDILRASGYQTRYVIGTIDVDPAFVNEILGVNTTFEALTLLWENYVPAELVNKKIRMEHVWVEAYIPYKYYRGYVMEQSGYQWVPLDASFVKYKPKPPYPVAPIDYDLDSVLNATIEGASIGPDYFTNMSYSALDNATEELMNLTDQWYAENVGARYEAMTEEEVDAIYADQPPEVLPDIVPTDTPFTVIASEKYLEVPEEYLHMINIKVVEDSTTILSFNIPSIETVGRQLTLDYVPADNETASLINQQESLTEVPAYLLEYRPILLLDSIIIAVGGKSFFGSMQELQVMITTPNLQDMASSPLQVGNYYAIAFDLGDMPAENVEKVFNATIDGMLEDDTMVMDHSIGGYMSLSLLNYFAMVDMNNQMLAEPMGLRWWRASPAVAVFGNTFSTDYLGSIPATIEPSASNIDVIRNVLSIQGDPSNKRAFALMSGGASSSWESVGFELYYNTTGVSTVDVFRAATEQGIPVYFINSSNTDKIDELNVSSKVKESIRNTVNQGYDVYVPGEELTLGNWTGVGWLVLDSLTGANAWMISDSLGNAINGGSGYTDLGGEYYESSQPNSIPNYNQRYQSSGGDTLSQRLSSYGNPVVSTSTSNPSLGMSSSDYNVRTTRYVSTSTSRELKESYRTLSQDAYLSYSKASRYGSTATGNYYLDRYRQSSTQASNALSQAKSIESTTSKSRNVSNSLANMNNGTTEQKNTIDTKDGAETLGAITHVHTAVEMGKLAVAGGILVRTGHPVGVLLGLVLIAKAVYTGYQYKKALERE